MARSETQKEKGMNINRSRKPSKPKKKKNGVQRRERRWKKTRGEARPNLEIRPKKKNKRRGMKGRN